MERFSCYWKNVRLKHPLLERLKKASKSFSCYWKNVRLKRRRCSWVFERGPVSVVIERMYDWSSINGNCSVQGNFCFSCYWKNVRLKRISLEAWRLISKFQLLLKECTIEAPMQSNLWLPSRVSVVIERMYDWSSETNWLKINDFWQLVSGLFFENGRSAQKVPLFSKIWGDCLTVFDSCGNI